MKLIIAAPANGISSLRDMSTDTSYPQLSFAVAQAITAGEAERAILICGTGIGTAIAANKVAGIRAATAHDLISVRGAVENYNAQILCMGQNVIAAPAAWALVDIWLNLRHDAHSNYAPKVHEISAFEQQK